MKAIEIIRAMVYDSALAECADLATYSGFNAPKVWVESYFVDFRLKRGDITEGIYLVLWQCDANRFYPFDAENPCDVVLVRNNAEQYEEDDREVWLYKID